MGSPYLKVVNGRFLVRLKRIKRSKVMSMGKFGPTASNIDTKVGRGRDCEVLYRPLASLWFWSCYPDLFVQVLYHRHFMSLCFSVWSLLSLSSETCLNLPFVKENKHCWENFFKESVSKWQYYTTSLPLHLLLWTNLQTKHFSLKFQEIFHANDVKVKIKNLCLNVIKYFQAICHKVFSGNM